MFPMRMSWFAFKKWSIAGNSQKEPIPEAEKHKAMLEKLKPMIAGRKNLTESDMREMLLQLEKDQQMAETLTPLTEDEKENTGPV